MSRIVWNRMLVRSMVNTVILQNNKKSPSPEYYMTFWSMTIFSDTLHWSVIALTHLWPYYQNGTYFRIWPLYQITRGFHSTFESSKAFQKRTLTPSDNCWDQSFKNFTCFRTLDFEQPSVLLFNVKHMVIITLFFIIVSWSFPWDLFCFGNLNFEYPFYFALHITAIAKKPAFILFSDGFGSFSFRTFYIMSAPTCWQVCLKELWRLYIKVSILLYSIWAQQRCNSKITYRSKNLKIIKHYLVIFQKKIPRVQNCLYACKP